MAITRAQQAKQMLQNGGRIGLQGGGRDMGTIAGDKRAARDNREIGARMDRTKSLGQGDAMRRNQEAFRVGVDKGAYQRFKTETPKDVNAGFSSIFFNSPIGKDFRKFLRRKNTEYFEDTFDGPLTLSNYKKFYQDMRDRFKGKDDGLGDADYLQIPQLPLVQAPSNMDQEPSEDEKQLNKLRLAFRADGGRIGLQEGGGIEQRLEQLGGDVSSAEKMLQGINQRLKTAESSLSSGGRGPGGLGTLANMASSTPGVKPSIANIAVPPPPPGATFTPLPSDPMARPGGRPLFDMRPINATLPATLEAVQPLEAAQPGPNPFGIINSLTDPRGPAFDTMENAYKNAVDSSAEMKRIGRLDQLDVLGGRLSFEDYKKNFSMDDEGFVTRNPGSTPLGMQSQGTSGVPAAGYADGGNVVGGEFDFESARQMYGLGKLVKKVTRTVKKIAKSPIGKAAIIGAGFGLAGMGPFAGLRQTAFGKGLAGFFGEGSFNPLRRIVGADKDPFFSPFGELFSKIPGGGVTAAIAGSSLLAGLLTPEQEDEAEKLAAEKGIDIEKARRSILAARREQYMMDARARGFRAEGGPAEGKEPVAKKTMPLLDMGGQEMDLRAEGGFVPIGRMEKADDVPARLSKNEFVFTADAVRNAGEGDVDKGAEVMYNMMKNLEAGGEVSEESQGLKGARKMFQTSQRLEEVL